MCYAKEECKGSVYVSLLLFRFVVVRFRIIRGSCLRMCFLFSLTKDCALVEPNELNRSIQRLDSIPVSAGNVMGPLYSLIDHGCGVKVVVNFLRNGPVKGFLIIEVVLRFSALFWRTSLWWLVAMVLWAREVCFLNVCLSVWAILFYLHVPPSPPPPLLE